MGEIEIRQYEPRDQAALLETFNLVFAEDSEHARPRTVDEWAWAYERNPAGQRIFLGLDGERVVSHYAAWPLRAEVQDFETHFLQIADIFVHPEYRWRKGEQNLFLKTGLAYFAAFGSQWEDVVHFGMPNKRHFQLGKMHEGMGYDLIRPHGMLGRGSRGQVEMPAEVQLLERFDEQVQWLYERCSGAWGASTIRDATYLNWRLVDHPTHEYKRLGVRDGDGILRGLAVVRRVPQVDPNLLTVIEWLVPPEEPEVGELLQRGLLSLAGEPGVHGLVAMFPDWSPWFEQFQAWGWLVHTSPYFMVGRSYRKSVDIQWLRHHWHYQFSDLDWV